ncbi:MAG: Flp pilus assembly complex ATPase component TadA [Clostridia bacterium]|nr:Flp pilus assembly complex ATPase component TadA [Clostridia bacterium]
MSVFGFKTESDSQDGQSKGILSNVQEKKEYKELSKKEYLELRTEVQEKIREEVDEDKLGKYRDEKVKVEIERKIVKIVQSIRRELEYSYIKSLAKKLANEISGYGPLDKYLDDTEITEIIGYRFDKFDIEKDGKLIHIEDLKFPTEEDFKNVIDRMITPLGQTLDNANPLVDARLPDGSRIFTAHPRVAIDGYQLNVRKFRKGVTMAKLVEWEALNLEIAEGLKRYVQARHNILVVGGTGTGKSTWLNCLSAFIPQQLNIITIEKPCELDFQHPRVRRWEAKDPNLEGKGGIQIRSLVKAALRARPDVIVVGEMRGAEAYDTLQAMATDHEGSMSTGHASTGKKGLQKFADYALMSGDASKEQIGYQVASTVDIVLHLKRFANGQKKLMSLEEVTGFNGREFETNLLVEYLPQEKNWVFTGNKSTRIKRLKDKGVEPTKWMLGILS